MEMMVRYSKQTRRRSLEKRQTKKGEGGKKGCSGFKIKYSVGKRTMTEKQNYE
jgi:hypothetical protein